MFIAFVPSVLIQEIFFKIFQKDPDLTLYLTFYLPIISIEFSMVCSYCDNSVGGLKMYNFTKKGNLLAKSHKFLLVPEV